VVFAAFCEKAACAFLDKAGLEAKRDCKALELNRCGSKPIHTQ